MNINLIVKMWSISVKDAENETEVAIFIKLN